MHQIFVAETNLRGLDLSELDSAVKGGSLFAGESVGLMVAGQSGLVEDGSVAADETPVSGLDDLSGVILNGQADVEHLAVVGDVGVVTVGLSLALEGGLEGGLQEGLGVGGEGVGQGGGGGLGSGAGQGSQDCQGGDGGHGDWEEEGLVAHHGEVWV